jgi:hypothetical protein
MAPLLELEHEVIFFEQEKRKVTRAEEVEKVNNAARWLNLGDWGWNALIKGHASGEGNKTYNQDISWDRAFAVRELLIAQQVPSVLLTAVGMGTSELAVPEDAKTPKELEKQRSQNRRVEIILSLNPMFARQPAARPNLWKRISDLPPPSLMVIPREQLPPRLRKVPLNHKEWPSYKKDVDEWAKQHHIDLDDILDTLLGNVPQYDGGNDPTPKPKDADDDGD